MRSPYEIRAQKELEQDGYMVDYKIRPRICPRGYSVDYFGLFDLIAYKPWVPIRWIAIKGLAGSRNKIIEKIVRVHFPKGNQKEIWWVNSKYEWQKKILT